MSYCFTSERLGFREWKADDLPPFIKMNKDEAVMEFFPKPLTAEQTTAMVERIQDSFAKFGYGLYAVDELATQSFIGFIGFWHPNFEAEFTPCTEIGWRIQSNKWNKGFATEGAIACLHHAFDALELEEIVSMTAVLNKRSERVMQKIGMQKTLEFQHPNVEKGHPLRPHVLYKIRKI